MSESKMSFSVTLPGTAWSVGWLFTIGFAHLSFGQAILALLIWPYYVGAHLS